MTYRESFLYGQIHTRVIPLTCIVHPVKKFFVFTCIIMLSGSICEHKIESPMFIWRDAITKFTQTPNNEHMMVMISIKSPIHPNIQSPIKG